MSSRDLFEEGDTGEAILPPRLSCGARVCEAEARYGPHTHTEWGISVTKVNDRGASVAVAHGDRDRSEPPASGSRSEAAPPAGNPLHETRPAEGAEDTVPTEPEYLTADEWAMRMALAWLAGYDPEAYALAMRRGRGDYS